MSEPSPGTSPPLAADSLATASRDDVRRAAGWLAWLVLGFATWWIVEGFLVATIGPNPRFLRPEPPRTSTLWGRELGVEPGVARRLEVLLRGGAVLHLIGRPAGPGPFHLLRVSTSRRLPSGFFRIDPGEPALHRQRLGTPEEASTAPGEGESGDWLHVDLDSLRVRFPEVARWSFFTLGDPTDLGRRVAMDVARDWLGTRYLAAALVMTVIGLGFAHDHGRGRELASGARALAWAACLPALAAALIGLEEAGVSARLVALAVLLAASGWLTFRGRPAGARWASCAVVVLAAVPLAWATARLVAGDAATAPPVVIDGAAFQGTVADGSSPTGSDPGPPITLLVVGERGVPFVEADPPPTPYPARLAELWRAETSERMLRIVDARSSLDPFRDPSAWSALLEREHPDVAIVELRPADPGPAWLPPTLGRPLAAALAPPARRRASPAELSRALAAARRAGAQPLLLVRPDPAAYLACTATLAERCAEVSRRALAALDPFDWVIDLNPPLQSGTRRLVPPFRDAAGALNAWGGLVARELRDQLKVAYRRAPPEFP
ncbi:MAG: hypothetical protein IPK07_05790 [Deltaproteobacteria bacterium]|nr:hypothetical protein [Deltaproteobacteria bacterium]